MFNQGDRWIVCDNTLKGLSIYTTVNYSDILSESIIIKVNTIESASYLGFNTCVSFVKRFIGLKDVRIQTPYQLLKRLQAWDY